MSPSLPGSFLFCDTMPCYQPYPRSLRFPVPLSFRLFCVLILMMVPHVGMAQHSPSPSSHTAFPAPFFTSAPVVRFATYLGGSQDELAGGIAMDEDGNVYVAGTTFSEDFPIQSSMHPHQGGGIFGTDIYVAKLSPTGEVLYATFLGGTGDEFVSDITVDATGHAYVVGGTNSDDFPMVDSLQGYRGGPLLHSDGFLAKLSPDGSSLLFSTYLGGTGEEGINGVALDPEGNIYLVGGTNSFDFPTTAGAFQPHFSSRGVFGFDAFVAKLGVDEMGNYAFAYATLLGGSGDEVGARIATDPEGHAYVTGYTNSLDFPLRDPIQPDLAGPDDDDFSGDVFVTAFSPDGSFLTLSTYLGGEAAEQSAGLTVDGQGDIYVMGWTTSTSFPTTPGVLQPTNEGGTDGFVARLVRSGGSVWSLGYATYLGGTGFDETYGGIMVDDEGRAFVAGITDIEPFPASSPIVEAYGGGLTDAFLLQLDADASQVTYATLLGGNAFEGISGVAANASGRVCITGGTESADLETHNAVQDRFGSTPGDPESGGDAFVACFSESLVATEDAPGAPIDFALHQNFPNPFNPDTEIRFDVKVPGHVVLKVYNVLGQEVRTLVNAEYAAGYHRVAFDARGLASGVYVYRIEMGDFEAEKHMVLLR